MPPSLGAFFRWRGGIDDLLDRSCVEILRTRRLRGSLHVRLRYRMWKHGADGGEIETYRSEQDAIFFPGQ